MLRVKWLLCSTAVYVSTLLSSLPLASLAEDQPRPSMRVARCKDFQVNGHGDAHAWEGMPWTPLQRRGDKSLDYATRVKMLYSDTGLYVLMDGEDKQLTAQIQEDFQNLWEEDVFEVFLWPDERHTIYFEYEISPLGFELPILVPNFDGTFLGWLPWHYGGERRIQKAVSIQGGEQKSGAAIDGWRAEFFIPYAVLSPLQNIPPKAGTKWRANFYRMDYDGDKPSAWDWSRVGPSFHEYEKFGTLIFD